MACVLLFLCFFGLTIVSPAKLPASFPRCAKKDPHIDLCLLKAVNKVVPELDRPIPALGLFPVDPLKIITLDIGESKGRTVNLKLKFMNTTLKGLSSIVVTNVKSDLENYQMIFNVNLAKPLEIESQYQADGRVLILPIRGNADCNLKLDNVKATFSIFGKQKIKDGKRYMDIKDIKLGFTTTKLTMYFQNLLGGGGEALGDSLNKVLNDNWKEILEDLQPAVEEALAATFKEMAIRVFSRVPYDQIFL